MCTLPASYPPRPCSLCFHYICCQCESTSTFRETTHPIHWEPRGRAQQDSYGTNASNCSARLAISLHVLAGFQADVRQSGRTARSHILLQETVIHRETTSHRRCGQAAKRSAQAGGISWLRPQPKAAIRSGMGSHKRALHNSHLTARAKHASACSAIYSSKNPTQCWLPGVRARTVSLAAASAAEPMQAARSLPQS